MKETALAFTDYASYCLTNIHLLQNSRTFPWLWLIFQISLTNFKIPWLFHDLENFSFSPDFPDSGKVVLSSTTSKKNIA